MPITTAHPLNLPLLRQQLATAGINVTALGQTGTRVHTYDDQGQLADLPDAAQPVVDAHDATQAPEYKQAQADAVLLGDFQSNLLQAAQALGWIGTLQSGAWGANTGQWGALTAVQQTAFMRRVLMAPAVLARRTT